MGDAYNVLDREFRMVMADADGEWNDFLTVAVNAAFSHHTVMPYRVGQNATPQSRSPNPRSAELYDPASESGEWICIEESELTLGPAFEVHLFGLTGVGSRRRNRSIESKERARAWTA
jgi:hypothetical protein